MRDFPVAGSLIALGPGGPWSGSYGTGSAEHTLNTSSGDIATAEMQSMMFGNDQFCNDGSILRSIVSAAIGPWMTSIYRWRSLVASLPVRPVDEPVSHAPGLDPDRVLLIGNGLAVGWGVLIHDLALPGFLSRALSAAYPWVDRQRKAAARMRVRVSIGSGAWACSGWPAGAFRWRGEIDFFVDESDMRFN